MDSKVWSDLIAKMGFSKGTVEKVKAAYMAKSDEEILQEISKLKETIGKNPKAWQQQMQLLQTLAAGMNEKEKARLERIMGLLQSQSQTKRE